MGFFLRKVLLLVIEKEQQNHTIPTLFETPAFSMQVFYLFDSSICLVFVLDSVSNAW